MLLKNVNQNDRVERCDDGRCNSIACKSRKTAVLYRPVEKWTTYSGFWCFDNNADLSMSNCEHQD